MDAESQHVEELKAKVAQLEKWNLMTDEQIVMDLKAEIERLHEEVVFQKTIREAQQVMIARLRTENLALKAEIERLETGHEIRLLKAELETIKAMR